MRSNNEPVRIRYKDLANGTKSIYLDTYKSGKRSYEFLKLYLLPEDDDKAKAVNAETLQKAEAIKNQRVQEILSGKLETVKASLEHPASTTTSSKKNVRLSKKKKVGSDKTGKSVCKEGWICLWADFLKYCLSSNPCVWKGRVYRSGSGEKYRSDHSQCDHWRNRYHSVGT